MARGLVFETHAAPNPVQDGTAVSMPPMRSAVAVLALFVAACSSASSDDAGVRARALTSKMFIVDGHVDLPYRLHERAEDISQRTSGDFDLPRARQGGL